MKYSIEEYERMVKSNIPCFFICPQCHGEKIFHKGDHRHPEICRKCEGSGQIIIQDNTTNNIYVLKEMLKVMALKHDK